MEKIAQHVVLTHGESFEQCCDHVYRFFHLTSLVVYDCIEAREHLSCRGGEPHFTARLAAAEGKNRKMVRDLTSELGGSSLSSIDDLQRVEQGYISKTLHILSHMLDGFIGVDSHFYNLIDDSHWLPEATAQAIADTPASHWLIHLDCYSSTPQEASVLHL